MLDREQNVRLVTAYLTDIVRIAGQAWRQRRERAGPQVEPGQDAPIAAWLAEHQDQPLAAGAPVEVAQSPGPQVGCKLHWRPAGTNPDVGSAVMPADCRELVTFGR